MKTKLFTLLLAVAASVGTLFASDIQVDGIWYNFNSTNKTAEVTYQGLNYNTYSNEYAGVVTIPASVTYSGTTYSVTNIGNYAFSSCSGLTSVIIPNSVTNIGEYAFWNCSGLTSVTIPNSVTSIRRDAFGGCSSLTSVHISDIAAWCTIRFGNSSANPLHYAHNLYLNGELVTDLVIPNSVTSIGDRAFYGCTGLTSVTIGNSVTNIGSLAFYDCSSLTSVTIPNSVTSIGDYAFDECSSLTAIYVPCGEMERFKQMLGEYSSYIKYAPYPYTITTYAQNGYISTNIDNYTICDALAVVTCTPVPNYGYHFVKWSDGNTDNPRMIELTQDITLTAEFAKNTYTISTTSANPEWGTTAGGKSALYLDEVEISATPNYGYHFVRWNDNNTSNPRIITLTQDTAFTATFAKNVYSITKNAEHGTISGNSSAEYLDYVTLTATPDYGYHFTQWSDGLKDNPRIFRLTQDTTFTAEFAYDRVGQCGKDLALVWSYDPANKVLTIGNAGEFTENMQFGVEAPTEMEELVIGNSVTAIGENAFAGISTLKSVKTIYDRAFYNCVNLETIFNYRPTPTNAYSTAFDGVDKFECILYVLPNSIDMYKNASVWRDFYYTYAIGAEEATVTTNDVKVEPQDNAATLTWPTSNEAFSYTIEITKDGVVFCRLTFNANGQLTGIAFAPGRDGQSMAPAAVMTANGLQFTVTGLDSNTHYGYSLTAKDANEQPIATYSGSFTTTSEGIATGIDNTAVEQKITKILRNGEVLILRDGKTYTIQGVEVK